MKKFFFLMFAISFFGSCTTSKVVPPPPIKTETQKYEDYLTKAFSDVYLLEDVKNTRLGSGFQTILGNGKKVIITNDHVCRSDKDKTIKVTNSKRLGAWTVAKVIFGEPLIDLCAVESIGEPGFYPLAAQARKFQPVRIYGYPDHLGLSAFPANLIGLKYYPDRIFPVLMLTVPTIPGNSGGPVVNLDEEVVGVVQITDEDLGLGGAVPLGHLKTFLTVLEEFYK